MFCLTCTHHIIHFPISTKPPNDKCLSWLCKRSLPIQDFPTNSSTSKESFPNDVESFYILWKNIYSLKLQHENRKYTKVQCVPSKFIHIRPIRSPHVPSSCKSSSSSEEKHKFYSTKLTCTKNSMSCTDVTQFRVEQWVEHRLNWRRRPTPTTLSSFHKGCRMDT